MSFFYPLKSLPPFMDSLMCLRDRNKQWIMTLDRDWQLLEVGGAFL